MVAMISYVNSPTYRILPYSIIELFHMQYNSNLLSSDIHSKTLIKSMKCHHLPGEPLMWSAVICKKRTQLLYNSVNMRIWACNLLQGIMFNLCYIVYSSPKCSKVYERCFLFNV